jgi:hypothetical protein
MQDCSSRYALLEQVFSNIRKRYLAMLGKEEKRRKEKKEKGRENHDNAVRLCGTQERPTPYLNYVGRFGRSRIYNPTSSKHSLTNKINRPSAPQTL